MAKRGDPQVLRLVVVLLRFYARMTQEEFGAAANVAQPEVSRYEQGDRAPSDEVQRRMARAARVPWPLVVQLRRFLTAFVALAPRWRSAATPEEHFEEAARATIRLAAAPYLLAAEAAGSSPARKESQSSGFVRERDDRVRM